MTSWLFIFIVQLCLHTLVLVVISIPVICLFIPLEESTDCANSNIIVDIQVQYFPMWVNSRRCRVTKGFGMSNVNLVSIRVVSRNITKHSNFKLRLLNLSAHVLKIKLILWVNQPHLVQDADAAVWTWRPAQTFGFWIMKFAVPEIPQTSGVDEIMVYLLEATSAIFFS